MSQFILFLKKHSTCFGLSFRPSSRDRDCTYINRHMSNRYCYCLLASRQQFCLTYACCCMYSHDLLLIDRKTVRNRPYERHISSTLIQTQVRLVISLYQSCNSTTSRYMLNILTNYHSSKYWWRIPRAYCDLHSTEKSHTVFYNVTSYHQRS